MKKFKTIIFISLLMLLVIPFKIYAADKITFSISGAPDMTKPGDTITLNVSETGANDGQLLLTSYNLNLNYDANILELQTGSPNITGSNVTGDSTVASYAFVIKAVPKGGTTNVSLTGSCTINGEESNKCALNGTTVKIREVSGDSSLSGLSIPNTPLTPAFNKNTKEYSANVKDVTQLTVNATATDPNASIQITDNRNNLQKGNNEIVIVVTSENGAKQTRYKINVNADFTPTEEELMKANASLSALEIKGQKIEFNQEEVKYYLDVAYDIKELEVTATAVNPNAQVQVSGNDKLIVGKNTVNIVVTAEDTTTTKTYSIMVTRLPENKKIIKTCPDTTSTKEWIIFSAGLFLTFTLGIVLGYILCKNQVLQKIFKKKEKVEEPVEIQSLSDTIDLSDTIEEIKDEEDVKKA